MSDLRDRMVALVAGQAHEDWRAGWQAEHGNEPRIKKTNDETWSAAHDGATELDIAATAYDDLPSDWQGENKAGAFVCVDAVLAQVSAQQPLDDAEFLESAAAEVHTAWVLRNPWAKDELKVSYAELPEEEKAKDRVGMRRAIEAYGNLA